MKDYFWVKLNSCRRNSSLKYEYFNIRQVWNFSCYIANDFPKINLITDEPQKDNNKIEVNKEKIMEVAISIKTEWLWKFSASNVDFKTLSLSKCLNFGFEDFGTENDERHFLNIYSKGSARHEKNI